MLDEILDSLKDGKFHTFDEVLAYVRSHAHCPIPSENQVDFALSFLAEYGFVKRLRENKWTRRIWKVQAQPSLVEFLKRLKELET